MNKTLIGISLAEYLSFALVAAIGGIVHTLQRLTGKQHAHCLRCAVITIFVDLITSAFAGLLMFLACKKFDADEIVTAILVAMAGHMGARLLFAAEKALINFMQRGAGANE